MFKKRFLLALAVAGITGLSFGNLNTIKSLVSTETTAAATVECTGGGSESFTNMPANSSTYATQSWTGDNSVAWEATDARTDQELNGRAITLRNGALTNTSVISGGIDTLYFNYARVFTNNSTLKVFVNNVQYGGDITVSETTPTQFKQAIEVSGDVTIRIENSGNRTVIDDLFWECSDAPAPTPAPELQLADACSTDQACGEYTIDFGSVAVNNYKDAVFTIKNTGNQDLSVTGLAMSDANFTVVSPASGDLPLTVAPSESAIVLVRFEGSTGGAKSGTLTIASNDSDEASCVVNLEGIALAACVAPATADELSTSNYTSTSADVSISNSTADSFLAIVSTSTISGAPVDGVNYQVGDALAGGVVAYVGSSANFTISDLEEDTTYNLAVFAFNNTNCLGGPLYAEEAGIDEFDTEVAPCIGGSESFENMPANSSTYATQSWTGDNGVTWEATDARTDQELTDRAIALRTGSLTSTSTITGGIGTLSFDYARVFTGNSVLKVYVNSVQVGADIDVTSDVASTYSVAVDVSGSVVIEIENSGNRTIIDNLSWNCYTVPNAPELQLIDNNSANQACGSFNLDFGNVEADTDNTVTFTIQNRGLQNLNITDIVSSDASYTVASPVSTSFTLAPNATQDVTINFVNVTPGTYPATLTISSNDADESSCVVNLNANAQDLCVAPDADGAVAISNITDTSADVAVTGNAGASGFIALVILDDDGTGVAGVPVNGTAYAVNDVLGDATVVYVGSGASFSVSGLTASTTNPIFIYAYNNTDCFGGPIYSKSNIPGSIVTTATPCVGGSESFDNMGSSSSSYATRTWTGDNDVVWSSTDSRTDQDLNGDAICIRTGTLTNVTAVPGGIGTLTFNYARVFSGNSTLQVYVNGVQVGSDITVSDTNATQFSEVVNVTGDITIELVNSGGKRTIIDDIAWDCYAGMGARPGAAVEQAIEENNFTQTATTNQEVVLYPNPNEGKFQVELPSVDAAAQVEVFDTLGKQVLSKKVVGKETINLENAGKGIYMVVITSNNNVTTKKVVIK